MPFDGEDVSDTLANVLQIEPDWAALPSDVPPAIRTLLQSCLIKDRRRAGRRHLDGAVRAGQGRRVSRPAARDRSAPLPAQTAVAARRGTDGRCAGGRRPRRGALVWFATRPAPPSVVRTTITTSGSAALTLQGTDRDVAITPDGSRVVYRGNNQLLVRALDQLEPTVLSGLGAPARRLHLA